MPEPFVPHTLPVNDFKWDRLFSLIGEARAALALYDGLLRSMLNPAVLLSPLTTREAVLSSKIEGTQATLGEVLQLEAGEIYDEEKTKDIHEILNYREAMFVAEQELERRGMTLGLVELIHSVLMRGVRGQDKNPGAFRNKQVWIGPHRCEIEQAHFVPPSPVTLQDHLENFECYVTQEHSDPLFQAGIMHAQFEIIHPFEDGNGRIGRMLIPLFLFHKNVLYRPMFYLSEYLEENRDAYYVALQSISDSGNWQIWMEFFLQAVIEQASANADKAQSILCLYNEMKDRFVAATHSQYALTALDTFFTKPIINTNDFLKKSSIENRSTANAIIRQLRDDGIICLYREGGGRGKPAVYVFPELINLSEGNIVFNLEEKET